MLNCTVLTDSSEIFYIEFYENTFGNYIFVSFRVQTERLRTRQKKSLPLAVIEKGRPATFK